MYYEKSKIVFVLQTYVGKVLLILNPLKDIENLHSDLRAKQYLKNNRQDLPPHIYGIGMYMKKLYNRIFLLIGPKCNWRKKSTEMYGNFTFHNFVYVYIHMLCINVNTVEFCFVVVCF